GFEVRMAALAADGEGDLQHGSHERRPIGIERFDERDGPDGVRRAAENWNADGVVWASATPGGGAAARSLGVRHKAWWWPTGWTIPTPSWTRWRARPGSRSACIS